MQLSDNRKDDKHQKIKLEQNKMEIVKKKTSFLKKKKLICAKLYSNVDIKHVVNVGDVCFVNEDALRNPESSQESLLKSLYNYKMISKVTLNNSFINIDFKKNSQNLFPPEYFIERLRSFGDQQMCNIANHLENINRSFVLLKDSPCPVGQQQFVKDKEESLLEKFVEKMQGRKYFLYFNEITPQKITFKNLVFSVPLLQALGCSIKNMALDFLKYRHIFFQVFTTKQYKFFIDKCFQNFAKIQSELMAHPDLAQNQRQQLTSFIYDDEIIRTKQGPEGIYEELCNVKVKWFSPHPSICCFQILKMDDSEVANTPGLRKIKHFQEKKPDQELNELKRIGIDFPLLKIDDEQKRSYFTSEDNNSSFPSGVDNNEGCLFLTQGQQRKFL